MPFPRDETERSIAQRFAHVVASSSHAALAVAAANRQFTFAELDRRASVIAAAIADRSRDDGAPVAMLLGDRTATIAAMLAAWNAGRACIPLDASLPPARLDAILVASDAALVIVERARLASLSRAAMQRVLDVDEVRDSGPVAALAAAGGDAPACILYTSGTTGEPKGVVRSHRSVLARTRASIASLALGPRDRMSVLHPPSTAGGFRDMVTGLLAGATLVPFDLRDSGFAELARWIDRERISVLCTVASTLRQLLASLPPGARFETLRVVRLGSEPLHRRDVERLRRHVRPDCVLITTYGATEANGITEYRIESTTPLPSGRIPAGYPLEGVEIALVDVNGEAVVAGEPGEVVVRSPYLSMGYWRRPELTRAAFDVDPADGRIRALRTGDIGRLAPDGCLELLGRLDDRVKVRGQRVNPRDIELALAEHPAIREAIVTSRAAANGEMQLVAHVVARSAPAPTYALLRRHLEARLPGNMIPSVFVAIDALPLAASGKVDRSALPEPAPSPLGDCPYVAPRTPVEENIAAMWEELFGVPRIGVNDDFIGLGGDSLLAARLVSMIEQAFGCVLSPVAPLRSPTVAGLAQVVVREKEARAAAGALPSRG